MLSENLGCCRKLYTVVVRMECQGGTTYGGEDYLRGEGKRVECQGGDYTRGGGTIYGGGGNYLRGGGLSTGGGDYLPGGRGERVERQGGDYARGGEGGDYPCNLTV